MEQLTELIRLSANLGSLLHVIYKGIAGLVVHFSVWIHQAWLCNSDSSGLKLSVKVTNPYSKLLCTEMREVYQTFRKQTLEFRT